MPPVSSRMTRMSIPSITRVSTWRHQPTSDTTSPDVSSRRGPDLAQSQQRAFWTQVIVQPFHLGPPTAPSKTASLCLAKVSVSCGSGTPTVSIACPPTGPNRTRTRAGIFRPQPSTLSQLQGRSLDPLHHQLIRQSSPSQITLHPCQTMAIPVSTQVLPHPPASTRDRPGRETR